MSITLEQIKSDIESGKSTMIFYSAHTLWWTHSQEDLDEATISGKSAQAKWHEELMQFEMEEQAKKQLDFLFKMAANFSTPLDPSGSPLMIAKAKAWIKAAEEKPDHFGKHQLLALISAHHQNCKEKIFTSWDEYNFLIDNCQL